MGSPKFSLDGKTVLITGSCGKLGKVVIGHLIDAGARVIGIDIVTATDLSAEYSISNFIYRQVDITSKGELVSLAAELETINWLPNVIINNAAAGQVSFISGDLVDFTEFPDEVWQKNLQVNLSGTLYVCQVFGKHLETTNDASIINISSTYGIVGCDQSIYGDSRLNSSIAYATTKSGIIGFTRYLAAYWGNKGIRVNAIAPAGIYNNQPEPFYSNYVRKIMLGRMGEASDISGALIYLASDAAKWVTGTILSVDGGYVAW